MIAHVSQAYIRCEIPMWDSCISHHMTFLTSQCKKCCVTMWKRWKKKLFPVSLASLIS